RAQERGLSGAVAAHHAVDGPGRHGEAHAAQRLDQHRLLRTVAHAREGPLQGLVLLARDAEADPDVVDPYGGGAVRVVQQNPAPWRGTRGHRRRRSRATTPPPRPRIPSTAIARGRSARARRTPDTTG